MAQKKQAARKTAGPAEKDPAENKPKRGADTTYRRLSRLLLKDYMKTYTVNPSLDLKVTGENKFFLKWNHPRSRETHGENASKEDLLALKIIADDLTPAQAAEIGSVHVGLIKSILRHSAKKGLLIESESLIKREGRAFDKVPDKVKKADIFTLQWHVTNMCDLRCRHCYDRSSKSKLSFSQGIYILDDLYSFCRSKNVEGHVCFTGGNPFMHTHFFEFYQAVRDRGFTASILGNPVSREKLDRLVSIQKPGYFQVSLEGLEEHNDYMRGKGHFRKILEFLDLLAKARVESAVMLTLTDKNIDQVLLLAEFLKDKTDYFTFNRLSQVGEGANLKLPDRERYHSFLNEYVDSSRDSKIMGFKDNLINIILEQRNSNHFDGCTGYGCGAAFNFLTVLPDGEVHACRKFPSPLGNAFISGISDIYESEQARRYRGGSGVCAACRLRPVCGGCMAVTHGNGRDIFKNKDPYCFINEKH